MEKTIQEKREYLENHFRYYTMSSWNGLNSFAQNIKISQVIPNHLKQKAYEFLELGYFTDIIEHHVEQFAQRHDYYYNIIQNGRSDGYLVLVTGSSAMIPVVDLRAGEQSTYSDRLGRWVYREEYDKVFAGKVYRQVTITGSSIEIPDDDVDMADLYAVVIDFDDTVKNIIDACIWLLDNHDIVEEEEEVTEIRTRKVLRLKGGSDV